ncbi:hypothetical protein OSTOST_11117, partial [Ostertagia ostertagi]
TTMMLISGCVECTGTVAASRTRKMIFPIRKHASGNAWEYIQSKLQKRAWTHSIGRTLKTVVTANLALVTTSTSVGRNASQSTGVAVSHHLKISSPVSIQCEELCESPPRELARQFE